MVVRMFYDAALVYDPESTSCDLALGPDGDLVADETAVTPMLLSIELDRRAAPDDELPQGRNPFLTSAGVDVRRGTACDALDHNYARIGSRCWLLERAKQTEETRLLFEMWLQEALSWAPAGGYEVTIEVTWIRPHVLHWRAMVDDTALSNQRRLA